MNPGPAEYEAGVSTTQLRHSAEHTPTLSENRVPRRIFGPRKDEVTGGCLFDCFQVL
jgi:hypothetical protein